MVDLAVVYGAFANLGQKIPLKPILKVVDYRGKSYQQDLARPEAENKPLSSSTDRSLDPRIAFLINDILSDNQARAPAFGYHSLLNIPDHQVAVKTGTSNQLRDNWAIGYTPKLLVATWVGNNDNSPMSKIASGLTGASAIWNQIVTNLLENQPRQEFSRPPGIVKVAVCPTTGTLPCSTCPGKKEFFLAGTEPQKACQPVQEKPVETREKILGKNSQPAPNPISWTKISWQN
jgi:membrane carboxypeptidase/penicillin-binding protein